MTAGRVATSSLRTSSKRARLTGALTALGGVILIVSTLPPFQTRVGRFSEWVRPFGLRVTGHVVSVAVGVALLYLAGQLARRRHLAWVLALALFATSAADNILRLHHFVALAYSLFMVVLLIVGRRKFSAPGDPPTLFEFVAFIPRFLLVVFIYGFLAIFLERNHTTPSPTFVDSLETIVLGLVGLDGPYEFSNRFFEWAFPSSLLALGIGGLSAAVYLLFRPIVARPISDRGDWHDAVTIVKEHSGDTLDYFALRDDKMFFFSSDRRAFIAYTFVNRHALVSGDPIGATESIALVVDEFLEMCAQRAWAVAFLAVRESERQMYLDHGLHTVYLGDEAVVRVKGFSLTGKRWKSIRQSSGRVERTYHFEWMAETDASPELIAELNEISTRWRGKRPERGFTMTLSQDVDGTNPDFRLCLAVGEDGRVGGFLRIAPVYGPEPGYTLDIMRRDPDTPNGMTEFLLTRTIMKLDELGLDRFSMNFAAWGRFFEDDVDYTVTQRTVKLVLDLLSPFYQIKSLKEFNQRFHPEWVPRCIVYEDFRGLPRVALLYSAAEGMLTLPFIGRFLLPRTVAHPGRPIIDRP